MEAADLDEYRRQVQDRVEQILHQRYGRDGDIAARGYGVTLQEAGYSTTGGWWSLQSALWPRSASSEAGTSFQTLQLVTRLDILLKDLLDYPEDSHDAQWAWRYGYRSSTGASRAFRNRFGLALRDAKRIAVVGRWLALAVRGPRTAAGVARQQEAERRVEAMHRHLRGKVGLDGARALERLGREVPPDAPRRRPRYPPIGRAERRRLEALSLIDPDAEAA